MTHMRTECAISQQRIYKQSPFRAGGRSLPSFRRLWYSRVLSYPSGSFIIIASNFTYKESGNSCCESRYSAIGVIRTLGIALTILSKGSTTFFFQGIHDVVSSSHLSIKEVLDGSMMNYSQESSQVRRKQLLLRPREIT